MAKHLHGVVAARETPQTEPVPGREDQVSNSSGRYVFAVDNWVRLERFLILGSEGGSYYASEKDLTKEGAQAIKDCIKEDGPRTVKVIAEISTSGRAPKTDYALFALAIAASLGDDVTRSAALGSLSSVARTGTHLMQFVEYTKTMRGFGRGLREAIARWYTGKKTEQLAYQLVKYQSRENWSHRDLLRKVHPTGNKENNVLFGWATHGWQAGEVPGTFFAKTLSNQEQVRAAWIKNKSRVDKVYEQSLVDNNKYGIIVGYELAKNQTDPNKVAELIQKYGLTREMIPTESLKEPVVWEALLEKMPLTALVRNLGNLSKHNLLVPFSEASKLVKSRLLDGELIRKSKVHPVQLLMALLTYQQGHGTRGHGEWNVVPQIVEALDEAFYLSFNYLPPTQKNWYLGLDFSGSMSFYGVAGIESFTPRMGAAVMAMTVVRTEANYYTAGFDHEMLKFDISPKMRLDDVVNKLSGWKGGETNCALPMLDAIEKKIPADVFVVYTDSETNTGAIHPFQALKQYRIKMNKPEAKLIVVAMVSNGFSIADPTDPGMLDVVGFDTNVPALLTSFVSGSKFNSGAAGEE